jgi:hypothetical protein
MHRAKRERKRYDGKTRSLKIGAGTDHPHRVSSKGARIVKAAMVRVPGPGSLLEAGPFGVLHRDYKGIVSARMSGLSFIGSVRQGDIVGCVAKAKRGLQGLLRRWSGRLFYRPASRKSQIKLVAILWLK